MAKRKVCVVVTARPSYSRVKTLLQAIEAHPNLDLQLVVGSSAMLNRYGDTIRVIEGDGFEPVARVYDVVEGENLTTMAKSAGIAMMELSTVFDNLRPDMVVSIADRYETLATSAVASFMNIPLVHLQGGEVTGSIDEKVRHANTKLADLHLVSTEQAGAYVARMGENPAHIYVTGCPSIDIAHSILHQDDDPVPLTAKYGGVGAAVNLAEPYIVVMQHPVTTEYNEARQHISMTLDAVYQLGVTAVWFWPNVDAGSDGTSKGIRTYREQHDDLNIRFYKNMLPEDFLTLIKHSRCIVGNSSVAIRECSYMGVPAVNIGTRQQGRERGANVTDVPYDIDQIKAAIQAHIANGPAPQDQLYGDGQAGQRMADILATADLTYRKILAY